MKTVGVAITPIEITEDPTAEAEAQDVVTTEEVGVVNNDHC